MTKTASNPGNGKEFEIEFYLALHDWCAGGKIGPDPRLEWQYLEDAKTNCWRNQTGKAVPNEDGVSYRWKPKKRTVAIDDHILVAPEVDEPCDDTDCFIENSWGNVDRYPWKSTDIYKDALRNGKIFLSKEDAEAMAEVRRNQVLGSDA